MKETTAVATDAVPEPLGQGQGMTSGLTAIDRARHGDAASVRVLVISASDGGRIAHAAPWQACSGIRNDASSDGGHRSRVHGR